jgi:hypothetical protein
VEFPVIWTQATWNELGCCRFFGSRICNIVNDDFRGTGEWNLYFVNHEEGQSATFLMFVVTDRDQDRLPDNWLYLRTLSRRSIVNEIGNELQRTFVSRRTDDAFGVLHCHVGLDLENVLTQADTEEPLEELNQIEVGASEENERELEIDRLIQQKREDDAECAIYEEIERELEIDRLVQQKLEDDAKCAFYEEMACEAEIDRLVGKRTRELILERTRERAVAATLSSVCCLMMKHLAGASFMH